MTPGTVVAAVSQAAEGVLVNAPDATNSVMGLYYSTDTGVTWQMSTLMDGSPNCADPQAQWRRPGGRAATAVVWNPVRQRFYGAIRYHGYYESADGVTWTRLANQPGLGLTTSACPTDPGAIGSTSCPIFRGALAVQPNTGDTFALTVDQNNRDQGLWQDVCGLSGANCNSSTSPSANSCHRPRWRSAMAVPSYRRQTIILRSPLSHRDQTARAKTQFCISGQRIFTAVLFLLGVCCGTPRTRSTDVRLLRRSRQLSMRLLLWQPRRNHLCTWATMVVFGDRVTV